MRGSWTLPCATPISAPKPSLFISFGPRLSTLTPSFGERLAALGHLDGSAGRCRGSETRSRARKTPAATARFLALERGLAGAWPGRRRAGVELRQLRLVLGLLLRAVAGRSDSSRSVGALGASGGLRRGAAPSAATAAAGSLASAVTMRAAGRSRLPSAWRVGFLAEADREHAGSGPRPAARTRVALWPLRPSKPAASSARADARRRRPRPARPGRGRGGEGAPRVSRQHQRAVPGAGRAWRRRSSSMRAIPRNWLSGRRV
jgi:hypothetical protein